MESLVSRQSSDAELQAAFRRHLPARLHKLLRRVRTQCRAGWDCNVLRVLHDELALLAAACGRYGMLDLGERLLALEASLERPLALKAVPDTEASASIDASLDGLLAAIPAAPHRLFDPIAGAPAAAARHRVEGRTPASGDVAGPAAANAAAQAPAPMSRGARVCMVDDDGALVNELLLRLEQQGCDVVLVERVEGLLERLRRAPPDLAIMVVDAGTPLEPLAAALRETRRDPAQRVRLLALLRGGSVELRLRTLRAGADRCITLPASAEDTVGAALELASIDQESAYRILIVDDDAAQALFAQAILRHVGMETRILGDARAVPAELDGFRPDLLLLDLNMPDCDGFELTALIRKRPEYAAMPIVFLSGDQDQERQFAALSAGGDDFLVKPIRPAHLVAAVNNRVRRARAASSPRLRSTDTGTGLREHAQLLDAVAAHLAAGGGRAAHGGLLAIELQDEAALRAHLGPLAFDELFAQIGAFVAAHVPTGCLVASHGSAGCLVFAATLGARQLAELADGLLEASRDTRFGAQASPVRLACAACAFDAATTDTGEVLGAVERALSAARTAPDRVAVASALDADPDALTRRIPAAIAADSFALAFQPIVPIRGAVEPQYQALLRLADGPREYVAAELVPVAIRIGSIAAVDAQVVRRCIALLATRARAGNPVRLFASQSLEGWRDIERPAALRAALVDAGVKPESLVLEFRAEEARRNLRMLSELAPELRRIGVGLALAGVEADAVGAGWLERLPLDYVKLAPGLGASALADVVGAAHRRGLRVVAPRVETAGQLERLVGAQVDLLQGHYFQPPARELRDTALQAGA